VPESILSPDGEWQWNGSEWEPTNLAPQQNPQPVYQQSQPQQMVLPIGNQPEMMYVQPLQSRSNGLLFVLLIGVAMIVLVAITIVIASVMYVWASSLAEDNSDGTFDVYAFDAYDASGTPSDGTDDNLVRVMLNSGGDINWASISVKVSINDGHPMTCNNPGQSGGSCDLVEFGDSTDTVWSVGDGVIITENGQDLCTTTCSISITITNTIDGSTHSDLTEQAI